MTVLKVELEANMTVNKQRAIKNTLARLGMHATSKQVADALLGYGIEVSERFVTQVKSQIHRDQAKAMRERLKRPPKSKSRKRPQQRKIPGRTP